MITTRSFPNSHTRFDSKHRHPGTMRSPSQRGSLLTTKYVDIVIFTSKTVKANTNDKIIGVSGCSAELLQIISCINRLRTLLQMDHHSPESELTALAVHLRMCLANLRQELHIRSDGRGSHIWQARIHHTAELYRIAAILYLYNTYPAATQAPLNSEPLVSLDAIPTIPSLVCQAFSCLDQIDVCTSPWPLFNVAINTTNDRHRIKIIEAFQEGIRGRRNGNYDVILGLVKTVWKRSDLNHDESSDGNAILPDWRTMIDGNSVMPSFS